MQARSEATPHICWWAHYQGKRVRIEWISRGRAKVLDPDTGETQDVDLEDLSAVHHTIVYESGA